MSDDLVRIEPQVLTKASPRAEDLLQARADVQSHGHLQELFRQGLPALQLAPKLAEALRALWPNGNPEEAAQFLADEYTQIGPEGVQLVSTETGRLVAIIREEDIYQPADVPREGGRMATPLRRIRPDLEAAIVSWTHNKDREQEILKALAARGHQTELLREMGDPRLLVASRRGRKHIVQSLAQHSPQELLEAAGGTSGTFLRFFEFGEPPAGHTLTHVHGTVQSKTVMGIQDALTTNLRHNRPAAMRGALVQGWVREVARILSLEASKQPRAGSLRVGIDEVPGDFWVGPPDIVRPFKASRPTVQVLPVEGSTPMTIGGRLGHLKVPKAFEAFSAEMFDRWEASTVLDFEAWVDLTQIRTYDIEGLEVQTQVLL